MLTRPDKFRCIECGLSSISPAFVFYEGIVENGPAYFTDQGVLCSPECSLKHHQRRAADGTLPSKPADDIYSE